MSVTKDKKSFEKKLLVGSPMSGNFSLSREYVGNLQDIEYLFKRDDELFARSNGHDVRLVPKNNDAEIVLQNFSSHDPEECESIYDLKLFDDYLVVVLYLFRMVRRIPLPSEAMNFYLERLLKTRLEENDGIVDEVQFLNDEFSVPVRKPRIQGEPDSGHGNRSIFATIDSRGLSSAYFEMYGKTRIAKCIRIGPGVFQIDKIRPLATNNRRDRMSQFFGQINFITNAEGLIRQGDEPGETEPKPNRIFQAWGDFIRFEKNEYAKEVREKGFLRYSAYRIEGTKLILRFDDIAYKGHRFFEESGEEEYEIVLAEAPNMSRLTDIDKILAFKSGRGRADKYTLFLGKCLNESFETKTATFEFPSDAFYIPPRGILLRSDRSIRIESGRREWVIAQLEGRRNQTGNMLLRLSNGDSDSQAGGTDRPINSHVLEKMFGKGGKKMTLTENYREAIGIAINTPDLAVIQGPPGTGKTTLIKGIVARLKQRYDGKDQFGNVKECRILVSSEQHEAMYNVVEKLSENKLFPPFVTSKRYGEEEEQGFEKSIKAFQSHFISHCDEILQEVGGKSEYYDLLAKIVFHAQEIKDDRYSLASVQTNMGPLTEAITKMGILPELQDLLREIRTSARLLEHGMPSGEEESFEQRRITAKLHAQRTEKEAFFGDDGMDRLQELQHLLEKYGHVNSTLPENILEGLRSDDEAVRDRSFSEYVDYVSRVKDRLLPKELNEFERKEISLEQHFDELEKSIHEHATNRDKDFYAIIEELKYRLADPYNASAVIKGYTDTFGSTCAQSNQCRKVADLKESFFHFVIIDEAARANPLDIMIPILLGIKVILIGDQMQLPHYIEQKYVTKAEEKARESGGLDTSLLKKSLFELIFESVERSFEEGRLRFKRHIMLEEQHRMHPVIGNFISHSFYHDSIRNGKKTVEHVNEFGVFDSKNVVWIDLPITKGMEKSRKSYRRPAEAEKVIETIQRLVRANPDKSLDIGIISYYNGQVDLIDEMLKKTFPEEIREQIKCGTVDSLQGKEFDIVILSTVRSNKHETIRRSLGFIDGSPSRINVSLSRARRLLIVIGDSETMGQNEIFRAYIDYVKTEGCHESK